jgi:hypothetical protein
MLYMVAAPRDSRHVRAFGLAMGTAPVGFLMSLRVHQADVADGGKRFQPGEDPLPSPQG